MFADSSFQLLILTSFNLALMFVFDLYCSWSWGRSSTLACLWCLQSPASLWCPSACRPWAAQYRSQCWWILLSSGHTRSWLFSL